MLTDPLTRQLVWASILLLALSLCDGRTLRTMGIHVISLNHDNSTPIMIFVMKSTINRFANPSKLSICVGKPFRPVGSVHDCSMVKSRRLRIRRLVADLLIPTADTREYQ